MKIGLVCPDDLSTVLYTKSFIRILREENGHEVFTISPIVGDYLGEIESLGAVHVPLKMERFVSPIEDLRYILGLHSICQREKFDLVVNWTTKPNVYGAIAEKLANVKSITCAVRGLGGLFLPHSNIKGKMAHHALCILYRVACKLSAKVWFTNDEDADYFLERGIVDRGKVILTKNAININDFSPLAIRNENVQKLRDEFAIDSNEKVVLMVARLIWSKGVREFIGASELLKDKLPDVKFILVAPVEDGQLDAIPEPYVREKGNSGNFQWVGFRKDIKEICALSDLAVLPSYYKEGGYPRALLEPMAFGKPVITTKLRGCRGPVEPGKNGYLVPPRDSRALAHAIELLIKDDSKRRAFGKYSRQKIEREFDDRIVVKEVLAELGIGKAG